MRFSDRLVYLRNRKRLTQKELAEKIKISETCLQNYEYGRRPTTDNLEKLADFFDVSTDYLLGRTNESVPPPKNFVEVERALGEIENALVIEE